MFQEFRSPWQSGSIVKSLPLFVLSAVLLTAVAADGAEGTRGKPDDWFVSSAKPIDRRPPQYLSGGETRDIIPDAPGAPGSQTERKRPPSPDYLMAKLRWGASAVIGGDSGIVEDWNLAPNDIGQFVELAKRNDFLYHWSHVSLETFSYNPKLMPAILISGVREVSFGEAHRDKLRQYVLDGGMIVCDSVYGSPWFYESALEEFGQMFPESRFRVLPPDHPLYHMVTDIDEVEYHCGRDDRRPFLEGLYVGSRVAVLVSRYGLGCGWQGQMEVFDTLAQRNLDAKAYSQESARRIATNLVPYILGYGRVGEVEGRPELIGLADRKPPTAEFVFAQARHGGAWNAHPGAARALLASLEKVSSISVKLKRVSVDVAEDDLAPYPFLFFTGLDDFRLSDKQIEGLRAYAKGGGTLLINNALGLASFHQAALREFQRVFPGAPFRVLPVSHEIYTVLHDVRRVQYTPTLQEDKGAELGDRPLLYGLEIDGKLGVIYSPFDMEAGWNDVHYPQSRGYENDSAKKLGMNVIMYSMTR